MPSRSTPGSGRSHPSRRRVKRVRGVSAASGRPRSRSRALPSQYFFRQCYVATDADEKVLRQVVEAVGDDNIVLSTDYPHADGLFPRAMEEFVALDGVSDKTKANILWDNCARLYTLTGVKGQK